MFRNKEIIIALGSTSQKKIDAAGSAFWEVYNADKKYFWQRRRIRVVGIDVPSSTPEKHVDEQPWGYNEGFLGAHNRLDGAKEYMRRKNRRYDYVVGVENTIIPLGIADFDRQKQILKLPITQDTRPDNLFDTTFEDVACVVVENKNGIQQEEVSAPVAFPPKYVKLAIASGFRIPAGNFISEELGGDAADPHMTLTNKPRSEFIKDALIVATAKIQNPI